jgi:hypothetical protein
MSFMSVAFIFGKLAVMSGGATGLIIISEKFNRFKYQPKKKEVVKNDRSQYLREKLAEQREL